MVGRFAKRKTRQVRRVAQALLEFVRQPVIMGRVAGA
jgi:hypothetical protein